MKLRAFGRRYGLIFALPIAVALGASLYWLLSLQTPAKRAPTQPDTRTSAHPSEDQGSLFDSFLGSTLQLPRRDAQGYEIPMQRLVVVGLPRCDTCTNKDLKASDLASSGIWPIVIVTEAALKDVDPSLRGEPTKFLIVAQANKMHIPDDLLMTWPAALVLTPTRTVEVAIPIQDKLEQFLARQR